MCIAIRMRAVQGGDGNQSQAGATVAVGNTGARTLWKRLSQQSSSMTSSDGTLACATHCPSAVGGSLGNAAPAGPSGRVRRGRGSQGGGGVVLELPYTQAVLHSRVYP